MRLYSRCAVYFGLVFSLVLATPGMGQDSVEDMLREMQEDMKQLREQNEGMRAEIDDLRALNDEDWLTGQRAEEIRGLVADVLADADTRSNLAGDGMVAGWSEHFFLASPDGRFKLQLDGQMQVRFLYRLKDVENDKNRHGFENTRTKLTFRGHVFSRDWTYLVRTDITRNEPGLVTGLSFLQDAWIRMNLDSSWSLRFGQFKLPFNREELVSSANQQAVERSIINEHLNIGRSQGVELTRVTDQSRFSIAYSDGGTDSLLNPGLGLILPNPFQPEIGVINTNALNEGSEWAFTARYERLLAGSWNQFEDFTSPMGDEYALMVGIAGHAQRVENSGQGISKEAVWFAYTADLSLEWGGANAFASFTHHYVDVQSFNFNFMAIVIQGGLYITPKVEIFSRFEYGFGVGGIGISPTKFEHLELLTLGANYYLDGHDVKWTTDLGIAFTRVDSNWASDLAGFEVQQNSHSPQLVFRTQFQLLF